MSGIIDVDEIDVDALSLTEKEQEQEQGPKKPSNSSVVEEPSTATTASSGVASDSDEEAEESSNAQLSARLSTTSQPIRRPRSSIKLSTLSEEIPLKNSKKAWKILPLANVQQINHDKVKRGATLPANYNDPDAIFALMSGGKTQAEVAAGEGNTTTPAKGVNFRSVQVRSYRQTISDNPSVSYGPPIGLDWQFEQEDDVEVDDFETSRQDQRRPYTKLGLNYYQRKALLEQAGNSAEDVKKAQKTANRDKFQRAVTKYFLPSQMLQDAAESAGRKTKRLLGGKQKKKDQDTSGGDSSSSFNSSGKAKAKTPEIPANLLTRPKTPPPQRDESFA